MPPTAPTNRPVEKAEDPGTEPTPRPSPTHVIALDVDGVILDFDRAARRLLLKIENRVADATTVYDYVEAWGLPAVWFDDHNFWRDVWRIPLQAYPDVEVIADLSKWAQIHLVSHRPKGIAANALRRDLRMLNLEHLFDAVHTVEHKSDKRAVLERIKADLYVDDHLHSLLRLEHPCTKLLRTRPWNSSQDLGHGTHYHRIYSLHGIMQHVNS